MPIRCRIEKLNDALFSSALGKRFASGAFWSVSGAVISRGLALLSSVIIARLLGQATFGELGIIQSTVGTLGIFAGLALGMTTTRYVARYKYQDKVKLEKIIAFSTLFSVGAALLVSLSILACSPYLATRMLNAEHLSSALMLASALVLFGALSEVQGGVLAGYEEFKALARINLLSGLIALPFIIFGASRWGLLGAVAGLVLKLAINYILNRHAAKKVLLSENVKPCLRGCLSEIKILWEFSFPAVLGSVVIAPVMWYANVLLVNQPGGYEEMGIVSAAQQWQNIILFVPAALTPQLLSILSGEFKKDTRNYLDTVKISFSINGVLSGFFVILISIFSFWIMSIYGSSFAQGWKVLVLLSASAFFISIIWVIGQVIASSGKMWLTFFLNALWGLLFLVLAIFLVNRYQAIGLAWAYFLSYACHFCWTIAVFYKLKNGLFIADEDKVLTNVVD